MTLVSRIAHYVVDTSLDDIDPVVVERAKGLCISALGSTMLGSSMAVPRAMASYAREVGGGATASVVGMGFETSTEMAAMLNCISSHCTEYEDVAWPEAQYTCFLLPAMFTLGEAVRASGRALLEAVILGFEVAARPGMICSDHGAAKRGFLSCANVGTIGAAAAAAKLMKLDQEAMSRAISLAPSMGGGLVRQTGSAAHVLEAGFAARDGIVAAGLAQRGLGGNPTILDGVAGYFDALAGQPDMDFNLGKGADLRIMHVGQKKYPCCYLLQRLIDSALEVKVTYNISLSDVERVEIEVNEAFPNIVKYDRPVDPEQARFSLPFAMAAALAGRPMDWRTFSEEGIADAEVMAALGKICTKIVPGSGFEQLSRENHVKIYLEGGELIERTATIAHGDAVDPLTPMENADEFRKKTAGFIGLQAIEDLIDGLSSLEEVEDVSSIIDLLKTSEMAIA